MKQHDKKNEVSFKITLSTDSELPTFWIYEESGAYLGLLTQRATGFSAFAVTGEIKIFQNLDQAIGYVAWQSRRVYEKVS